MLWRVAGHKYVSMFDLQSNYEQMRTIDAHVHCNGITTPDGVIESLVLVQGDTNGPATCQALMNHTFSPYLGVFVDVYLDDIVVYSDTLEDHIKHCKIVFDLLHREKFYLSKKKCQIMPKELHILGHIIDGAGIRMDPAKVDSVKTLASLVPYQDSHWFPELSLQAGHP